jgi:glycosyltransferase involved in cell wall biosynthesis
VLWQCLSTFTIHKIIKQFKIDLFHHITFIQYRGHFAGFFIKIPFIFGPIGGAEKIPKPFFKDLTFLDKLKESLRYMKLDLLILKILKLISNNCKIYVFSNNATYQHLKKVVGSSKYFIHPAIGINLDEIPSLENGQQLRALDEDSVRRIQLIYVGRFESWKGLEILIKGLSLANKQLKKQQKQFMLKLIGARSVKERQNIAKIIYKYSAQNYVDVVSFLPQKDVIQLIAASDVVVYPAYRDSGSMAVLEAMAAGKAVLCFDTQGQNWVPSNCAIKIPFGKTYDETLNNLVDRLVQVIKCPEQLNSIGNNAKNYVSKELTWDAKARYFSKLYMNVCD